MKTLRLLIRPLCWHLAVIIMLNLAHPGQPLEIEHPHSFSMFKRGVMLGDVSYSYSSTDMGSPETGRYKTVTVIKNIAVPKPTSTMFSDRSEHFYDSVEKGASSGTGQKKRTHVEYWPPKEDNHVTHHKQAKPEQKEDYHKISNTHRPYGHHQQSHHRSRTEMLTSPKVAHKPPPTKELPQEEPQHPIDLLELAKSAVKTLNQKAKIAPGENTGPVTFPADAMMMKKKNGIVSVAKEYTSVLTTDPKDHQLPIVSKLRTKVDPPPKTEPAYHQSTYTSEEIPLKEFEQSEYVFNHKTGSFEFRAASKAPKAVQEYLRGARPYRYKEQPVTPIESEPSDYSSHSDGSNTYNTPSELLFAELRNAVATRNVTMIKSLAGQLEETFNIGKLDFESLKMEDFGRRSSTEDPMMETTTGGKSPLDFGFGNYAETTTIDYQEPSTEAIVASTTIKAPIMMTTTTKKPLRYIAPKLRGFKRFSAKRQ